MVTGALNHRAVIDTIGHPLDFIPHIMALSPRMDTDFLGSASGSLLAAPTGTSRPDAVVLFGSQSPMAVAGDQLAVVRTSRPLATTARAVAALFALRATGA
jgi:hypothetical protein